MGLLCVKGGLEAESVVDVKANVKNSQFATLCLNSQAHARAAVRLLM